MPPTPLLADTMQVFNVRAAGAVPTVGAFSAPNAAINDVILAAVLVRAAAAGGGIVYFPPGTYDYTLPLTVTVDRIVLSGDGAVSRLRYHGAGGNCVFFDGGAAGGGIYGCGMNGLVVDGGGVGFGDVGVRIRGCHWGMFSDLLIVNVAQDGVKSFWGIGSTFQNVRVTVNEEATTISPVRGFHFAQRGAGEPSNANLLLNCTAVACNTIGLRLDECEGMIIDGCVFEAQPYGLFIAATCARLTATGTWLQANTVADLYCEGSFCTFNNILVSGPGAQFPAAARNCLVRGGLFTGAGTPLITISPGANGIVLDCPAIDGAADLTDAGTATRWKVWDIGAIAYVTGPERDSQFVASGGNTENNPAYRFSTEASGLILYAAGMVGIATVGVFRFGVNNLFAFTQPQVGIKSGGGVYFAGVLTPAAIAANTNDYAPAAGSEYAYSTFRISSTAPFNITGFANVGGLGLGDGQDVTFINIGAFAITFKNLDGGSVAGKQFSMVADVVVPPGGTIHFRYDVTGAKWICVGKNIT